MNQLLKAIELKKELDAFRPLEKDVELRIMQKFRLDWNFHSNSMEGNTLTYGETKALLLHNITAQGKPLRDHLEITGHNEAIKWVLEVIKAERPLTENFIRELHTLILKEPYQVAAITPDGSPTKKWVKVGSYKETPNHVKTKTGEIFRFATPEETPALMHDLIQWYRKKADETDVQPILLAAEFHYRFIHIHPFDDGNGRTVRILMNFILMRFGFPPVVIKAEDKHNYIAALEQADAGLLEPFVSYITENLVHSLELMLKAAKGGSIEEEDDIDKQVKLLEQKLNSIGKKVNVLKSKKSLYSLYRRTLIPLSKKFKTKAYLFNKFYFRKLFQLIINGLNSSSTNQDDITHETNYIKLVYKYITFNNSKIVSFNFQSEIIFNFEIATYYSVYDFEKKVIYKKAYDEPLTDKEMTELVNAEITRHMNFIEQKIAEFNEKEQ